MITGVLQENYSDEVWWFGTSLPKGTAGIILYEGFGQGSVVSNQLSLVSEWSGCGVDAEGGLSYTNSNAEVVA